MNTHSQFSTGFFDSSTPSQWSVSVGGGGGHVYSLDHSFEKVKMEDIEILSDMTNPHLT